MIKLRVHCGGHVITVLVIVYNTQFKKKYIYIILNFSNSIKHINGYIIINNININLRNLDKLLIS